MKKPKIEISCPYCETSLEPRWLAKAWARIAGSLSKPGTTSEAARRAVSVRWAKVKAQKENEKK